MFHLRPDLTFSDGTPLRASDVVRSWLRLIDPAHPSPLASLMLVVDGAQAYLTGADDRTRPRSALRADDAAGDVTVELVRPASDFVDVVVEPVVRDRAAERGPWPATRSCRASGFVGSGGYVATARPRHRADAHAPTSTTGPGAGDRPRSSWSPTSAAGARSRSSRRATWTTPRSSILDASWIAYDETLGPQLREVPQYTRPVLRLRHEQGRRSTTSASGRPFGDGRRLAPDRRLGCADRR